MVKIGCSNASFRPQFITELRPSDLVKLKLPSEFMMCLEDEDNSRLFASIVSPLRKPWIIKLVKNQSETFFYRGWHEFTKFHKIEVGFKLVFRYEGNMLFTVKVFDLNGCRKNYYQGAPAILRVAGLHDSKEKSPAVVLSSSGKQAKRKHDRGMEKETPCHEHSKIGDERGTTSKSSVKKQKIIISTTHLRHETRMSHCNIYKFLALPKKFGSELPYNLEKGDITVQNVKEESWNIKFNTCSGYNYLCGGWRDFCWKNDIKVGDKCTLTIIAQNKILVCVSKAVNTVKAIDVDSDE